jgi:hypothetical protein
MCIVPCTRVSRVVGGVWTGGVGGGEGQACTATGGGGGKLLLQC